MFHRHLIHMCESHLTKPERRVFNVLTGKEEVLSYLADKFEDLDISTVQDGENSFKPTPTPQVDV